MTGAGNGPTSERWLPPAVLLLAVGLAAILIVFAGGYGYHRDELYFLAAGHHLSWAYADQGALTPVLARLASDVDPTSLTVLRVLPALAAAGVVVLTAAQARELGASRRGATIAALCAAVASIVLFTGHLLSTSTFDLLAWTAVTWLVIRAVRTGDGRWFLVAGVVLGIGLMNKPLPAFLALGLAAGVLIAGPRRLLRNPYVWAGAIAALVIWSPWLIWQASHGWPQIDVSRSIASGNSTSSQAWWAVVPFQFLLVSPVLAPVWIAGLVRLFREPRVRDFRFLAWAWVVLAVVFMASSGKPYYLAGLLPALLAAGSASVDGWLDRGRARIRRGALGAAIVLSGAVSALIALPLLPARDADPVIGVNPDVGETIGWPALVRTVAGDYGRFDHGRGVILTSNYGEAGAIDRYGPAVGLPGAFSGHNAFGYWGPPPGRQGPVLTVGMDRADLRPLVGCRLDGRIGEPDGIDNDEAGEPIMSCRGPARSWSAVWPRIRHLG